MTPEVKAELIAAMHRRATALARVTSPTVPHIDVVIAHLAENLVSTIIIVLGPEMYKVWLDKLWRQQLQSSGLCRFCGERPTAKDKPMCQTCWDAIEEEERAVDSQVALNEKPPQGGIS